MMMMVVVVMMVVVMRMIIMMMMMMTTVMLTMYRNVVAACQLPLLLKLCMCSCLNSGGSSMRFDRTTMPIISCHVTRHAAVFS